LLKLLFSFLFNMLAFSRSRMVEVEREGIENTVEFPFHVT